jgi:hypothetical protein
MISSSDARSRSRVRSSIAAFSAALTTVKFVRVSNLTTGRNVMLFRDDLPRVEVGAEVSSSFTPTGRVIPSSLPEGQAAEWCAANGLALSGVRWEIYGHWLDDQDPAPFEAEIYWLLEP